MSYMQSRLVCLASEWALRLAAAVMAVVLGSGSAAIAQPVVPPGFSQTTIATGLFDATCMTQTPDGRILIAQKSGRVRVWKDGVLLATAMHTFSVGNGAEQGLIGLTVDPGFTTNGYVYAYINATAPSFHGKLVRFTVEAGMDVSQAGSQVELFDLGASSNVHLGGEVQFGLDGKIYVALGDHANSANAQNMSNIFGKILRLNADGTIPEDNPFYATAEDDNRAIWALGLRNPFTFAFEPGTGRMLINDVGNAAWEEVNEGIAGANYGWPQTEGGFNQDLFPTFTPPLLAYHHSNPGLLGFTGHVVIGGAFYPTESSNFPASLRGHYFFGDFTRGWVRTLHLSTNISSLFATGFGQVVDFGLDSSGRLLVLRQPTLTRVQYDNPIGACCVGFVCTALLEADCVAGGGVFLGVAVPCLAAGEPDACCTADFDGNGQVQVPDIFAFLSAWFANDPRADIDGEGGIQVPDIFAFLSLWFAGCSA